MSSGRLQQQFIRLWQCCDGKTQDTTLNELAERVGISNVNLSKIKNNKVTAIRFSTLAAICEALNCDAGDILEYREEDKA